MAKKGTKAAASKTETVIPEVNPMEEVKVEEATIEAPASEEVEEPEAQTKPSETPAQEETQADKRGPRKKEQKEGAITEFTITEDEVPDYARRIMKLYPEMPEMYINRFDGVFTVNSKPSERGDAILFKNIYYKK